MMDHFNKLKINVKVKGIDKKDYINNLKNKTN